MLATSLHQADGALATLQGTNQCAGNFLFRDRAGFFALGADVDEGLSVILDASQFGELWLLIRVNVFDG